MRVPFLPRLPGRTHETGLPCQRCGQPVVLARA